MEKEKACKCKDWKEEARIINSALSLYVNHGFDGIKVVFTYCPYCGEKLKEKE